MGSLASATFDRIAKALADGQRCRILEKIAASGELCCSEIVDHCSVSQATISHHLKELVTAELIERRKHGQFAYFRFNQPVMAAYVSELQRRLGLVAAAPHRKR
ncbi:MAG: winged helix-turn-helix transcriptional regulator [Planctomycetes bacterium]|nr:winged helix-turn-helix transcriptional regulator [Planctomycetota bacterium]